MPSIFDLLNPQQAALASDVPRPPSILDSPDYRSERLGDALRGMSAALVRAGAPSPYPQGFAEVLGQAGMGVGQGMEGSEDKFLKRAMVNAQVQKAESEIANEKAWRDMFSGAGPTATPASPAGAPAASGGYEARVSGLEGGKKNGGMVYNELGSGAGGPYQIMPGTWTTIRAAHPELNLPETMPVDNKPETRALHDAAHAAFKADNATQLKQAGLEPTPDNLYLAHRFGVGGAMAVLRADPNKSLAEVLPVSWQAQNPDMRGQTAGGFRRLAAERMQGVGQPYTVPPNAQPTTQYAQAPQAPPAQGDAVPSPVQTDSAPPPAATGGPVQLAQATPPQPAAPAGGPVQPPAGGPRSLQEVIQTMPPGVRQMVGAMGRKDGMGVIMKYADPETHVAIDSTTGQIVFAPKTDKSGRYVPVDVMKLDIERQNAASQAKQAAAREEANRIRGANEPMQPGVNGGPPTPTPGFPEAKGAVSGAEEAAKVQPKLLAYQGELVIKDHGQAQAAASKARQDNNDLSRLDSLLQGIQTGKMTPLTQDAKAWAKAAGFNLDALGVKDDVGNTQAAQSVLNRMALEMRNTGDGAGMPGSMSDADRNFLTKIPPELATTPEGRKMIVDYMKWANQRTIDIAEAKNKFVQSEDFAKNPAKMYSEVKKFADSYPSFSDKNPLPTAAATPVAPSESAIDAEMARRKAAKGAK